MEDTSCKTPCTGPDGAAKTEKNVGTVQYIDYLHVKYQNTMQFIP